MAGFEWPDVALKQLDQIAACIEQLDPAASDRTAAWLFALGNSLSHVRSAGALGLAARANW